MRVHPKIMEAEGVSDGRDCTNVWGDRYRSIVDVEQHLHQNGTRIVKFFLHLSKNEQRRQVLARFDDPNTNWKFSRDDVQE